MAEVFTENGKAVFTDPTSGAKVLVDPQNAQRAADEGLLPVAPDQGLAELSTPGGVFATEALNTLTFGGLKAGARAAGVDPEIIAGATAGRPGEALAGQTAGLIGSLALPGIGAAGAAGRAAGTAAARGGSQLLGRLAAGAGQGLVASAQLEASQISGEQDIDAASAAGRILSSAAKGAAIGGALNVLAGGVRVANIQKGLTRAVDKVTETIGSKLDNILSPLGAGGKAISNLVGKVAGKKVAGDTLKKLINTGARFAPLPNVAEGAARLAPISAALQDSATTALKTDYLAAASEGIESGVLSADATPDAMLEESVTLAGRPKSFKADPSRVISASKTMTPEEHAAAAQDAYVAAGASQTTADSFAEFHAKRISLLQTLSTDDPIAEAEATKTLDAVFHPEQALRRIEGGDATPEDLKVIKLLYPGVSDVMSKSAEVILDDKVDQQIDSSIKAELQKLAGGKHRQQFRAFVDSIQQGYTQQQQQGPNARVAGLNLPPQLTALQRNSLGG